MTGPSAFPCGQRAATLAGVSTCRGAAAGPLTGAARLGLAAWAGTSQCGLLVRARAAGKPRPPPNASLFLTGGVSDTLNCTIANQGERPCPREPVLAAS